MQPAQRLPERLSIFFSASEIKEPAKLKSALEELSLGQLSCDSSPEALWSLGWEIRRDRGGLPILLSALWRQLERALERAPRVLIARDDSLARLGEEGARRWALLSLKALAPGELIWERGLGQLLSQGLRSPLIFEELERLKLSEASLRAALNVTLATGSWALSEQREQSVSVGRELERSRVEWALRSASREERLERPIIQIRARAGMGKSTFLSSVSPLIAQRGLLLARALCVDFVSLDVLGTLTMLAHALLRNSVERFAIEETAARAQLEALMTRGLLTEERGFILAELLGLELSPAEQSALSHYPEASLWTLRCEQVAGWIRALAERQPLCVLIEDVHWLRDELHELFKALFDQEDHPSGLIFIVTSRPERGLISRLPELSSKVEDIELRALSLSESRALARALTEGHRSPWQVDSEGFVDSQWLERCVVQSEGHPLFLTQLLKQRLYELAETGAARASEPSSSRAAQQRVALSLDELLLRRFEGLSSAARQLGFYAACLGQLFNPELISKQAEPHNVRHEALLELKNAQLIHEGEGGWRFSHALIRDSIYQSFTEAERREAHRALAEGLTAQLELRAEHLALAADMRALEAHFEAAEERLARYQPQAALALYERASRLELSDDERVELLCRQGWLFEQLGDGRSCLRCFHEASALQRDAEAEVSVEVILGRLAAERLLGELDRAELSIQALEQSLKTGAYVFPLFKARFAYYRGCVAFSRGALERCARAHQEAVELLEAQHSLRQSRALLTYAQAWSGMGDALYAQGRFREAQGAMSQAVELARTHRFGRVEVSTLHMLAIVTTYLGDSERGLKLAQRCHGLAQSVNDSRAVLFAELNMVLPMLWSGQSSDALSYCHSAVRRVDWMNSSVLSGMAKAFLAFPLWIAGERAQASSFSALALELSSRHGERLFRGVALGAALLSLKPSPQQVEAWVDQGLALLAQDVISHNYLYFALSATLRLAELRDQARLSALHGQLSRFFQEGSAELISESSSPAPLGCVAMMIQWVALAREGALLDEPEARLALIRPELERWSELGVKVFKQLIEEPAHV